MASKYFLVGVLFCLLLNLGLADDAAPPGASTTTSPDITTTETTTPTPTTTIPTTTPTTTKATTTATTTTTTTTTTPKTTTTTTTTPPSTTPTTTTTTGAPSTTTAPPAPKPLPEPEVGSWVLNNTSENLTCAVIHMALRMKIPYNADVNKTEWGLLNLPKNANISGECNSTFMEMNVTEVMLSWDNNTNFLKIVFTKYVEKKSFNITKLVLTQMIGGDAFPNSTVNKQITFASNGSGLLSSEYVPLGSSYKCSHKVNLNMTDTQDVNATNAVMIFSKVQIQAFMNSTSGPAFGTVLECPGMDASDIVPIAVGCALASLVIGVLIAYLVGRRRSHARGYLSM